MAETETLNAAAYTALGTERERVALPGEVFDGTVNMPVLHQAVKAFLANQRQGTAATKIRKYVIGGNQKPWKQKGTGRARQGSIRAPHWVGGGTVFGPQPRSYRQDVPRQVKALARKSAFNARAREDALLVVDRFELDAPKTKRIAALLDRLDLGGRKVLILTNGLNQNVYLSARNIPDVQVMPYGDVSAYHLLWSDVVLVEGGALGQELEPIAETEPAERKRRPAKKARPAREEREAKAPAARKKTARKAAKPAARKAATKSARKAAKPAARKKAAPKKKGGDKKKGK
ncbi:MAG TPA: 50S ribosomal protein L4 [Gemmatimonadaceae bacterium]|nr:50S ribosomal protein L4 [Gemmatimonadaceae bacterium]